MKVIFIFNNENILVYKMSELPYVDYDTDKDLVFVCEYNNTTYYVLSVDDSFSLPSNTCFMPFIKCKKHYKNEIYNFAIAAKHLLNWDRNHKYCGVCGAKLPNINKNRSKLCSSCGNLLFPETAPAIIVGIRNENKLLLAHNTRFKGNMYSIIAGFVELGENLTAAVKREIKEEVGISVKNIKYFDSQPWPFPNSLMIGFTADYDSGEINVDGVEIEKADWFTADELPEIPTHNSIARHIIDEFVVNNFANLN